MKHGLFFKKTKEDLIKDGDIVSGTWNRSTIMYNDTKIAKTSDFNNFGLYYNGELVCFNGDPIFSGSDMTISDDNGSIYINGRLVKSPDKCVNITIEDYNKLRTGQPVDGYLKYDRTQVYNLVDNVETAPIVSYTNSDKLEDLVYNSISNSFKDNEISDLNFTDPLNSPELAIRSFTAKIKEGEGLSIEYFVDTHKYDSIYKGNIHDTFTTIITDQFDNIIYKKTTYAGTFKASTKPIKSGNSNFVGETWIRIRTTDDSGRASVDYFYNILVLPDRLENIYLMKLIDLTTYGITLGENVTFELGYKNRSGLNNFVKNIKTQGYDRVKLYNPNGNAVYTIDPRTNVGTTRQYIPAGMTYFIVKYDGEGRINALSDSFENDPKLYYINSNKKQFECKYTPKEVIQLVRNLTSTSEVFELVYGQTITIDSQDYVVDEEPWRWVLKDGAHLYRSKMLGENFDKILVRWKDVNSNEVNKLETVTTTDEFGNEVLSDVGKPEFLRAISGMALLKHIVLGTVSSILNSKGYYYIGIYDGEYSLSTGAGIHTKGELPLQWPDNITIDLNGATLKLTSNTAYDSAAQMFSLVGNINTNITNGTIEGAYTIESIKEGYIKQTKVGGSVWEAAGGLFALHGARFCTISNLVVKNSHGYELYGGSYGGDVVYAVEPDLAVDFILGSALGYINGTLITNDPIIKGKNGESLCSEYYSVFYPQVDKNANHEICIITSDFLDISELYPSYGRITSYSDKKPTTYKRYDVNYMIEMGLKKGSINYYGGSMYDKFVSFYDNAYNLITTIKTRNNTSIKRPDNAKYVRLTAYTICKTPSNTLYTTVSGDNTYSFLLENCRLKCIMQSEGNVILNCTIRDTRTIALGNPGINATFDHIDFRNICATDRGFTLTPMLCDVEENNKRQSVIAFRNCTCDSNINENDSIYKHKQSAISGFVRGLQIVNCNGLTFLGECPNGIIYNSDLHRLRLSTNGGIYTPLRYIIKDTTVNDSFNGGYSTAGRNRTTFKEVSDCKSVWEEPVTEIAFNNCFMVNHIKDASISPTNEDSEEKILDKELSSLQYLTPVGQDFKIGNEITNFNYE